MKLWEGELHPPPPLLLPSYITLCGRLCSEIHNQPLIRQKTPQNVRISRHHASVWPHSPTAFTVKKQDESQAMVWWTHRSHDTKHGPKHPLHCEHWRTDGTSIPTYSTYSYSLNLCSTIYTSHCKTLSAAAAVREVPSSNKAYLIKFINRLLESWLMKVWHSLLMSGIIHSLINAT